jgi:hypothetical protein
VFASFVRNARSFVDSRDQKSADMQIENIACNSCGAPLEVSATTQFATCRHCGAKLSIQRTDTAVFTEILEKLTTKTDQLSEQVNNLSGLTEIAALDREWELEREKYLVTFSVAQVDVRTVPLKPWAVLPI